MESLKVYCRGKARGEASLRPDGDRLEIRAAMDDPGDGLYRAALCGEGGQLALGVLEQKNGKLLLCRRPCRSDVDKLGVLLRVEALCSFPFRKKRCWELTRQPAELFRTQMLRERLGEISEAWFRREGEHLLLALELREGCPFPLELLFCLGKVRTVEGRRCVVYGFDGRETPLLPGNDEN